MMSVKVEKNVLEKVLKERTILVVKMGQRLEPVVDSSTQELLLKSNDRFETIKFLIENGGYETEEIVLEVEEINRLLELLDDYYMKKIDAIAAYAEILKDYVREDDMEYLMHVDPVSAGAFLVRDEEGIYIETDISAYPNEEKEEELSEDDLKSMSSKDLLTLFHFHETDYDENEVEDNFEDDHYYEEDCSKCSNECYDCFCQCDEYYQGEDDYEYCECEDCQEYDEFEENDLYDDESNPSDIRNDKLREVIKSIYRS